MYGLDAIANANGWVMAIAGALIVMAGLATLSFVISRLPDLILLLDRLGSKRKKKSDQTKTIETIEEKKKEKPPEFHLDTDALVRIYAPLVEEMGESFQLKELYKICQEKDYPHAHLSIRTLREAGVLVQTSEGVFSWNK